MAKFVVNNRKNKLLELESSLSTFLEANTGAFMRLSKPKRRKWAIRRIKHYLHTLQLLEQANKLPKTVSFVYVLHNKAHEGFVKVGTTRSVEDRLSQYRVYTPTPSDLSIFYIPTLRDGYEIEKQVLDTFSGLRASGEWIQSYSKPVEDYLKSLFEQEFEEYINAVVNY